ncbi:hypothetical protein PAHAL_6G261300 [Panicum hallii]|uniref:Uncharacterized protein n=1 Tax=Panicum hallii TaxID=206008 RepID=A0A2T8IHN3_9POAL|nr:hypothetical protein PAHAL_6G261300 [Panicum hallii]
MDSLDDSSSSSSSSCDDSSEATSRTTASIYCSCRSHCPRINPDASHTHTCGHWLGSKRRTRREA